MTVNSDISNVYLYS